MPAKKSRRSRHGAAGIVSNFAGGRSAAKLKLPAPPPIDIKELTARAMAIRSRFAALERRRFRRTWTRAEIMQGFVVDVGDLMKLVMAKSGVRVVADVDQKLAHELSDCLWSVLVLARLYGVDLEHVFLRTMSDIEAKIARQGRGRLPGGRK